MLILWNFLSVVSIHMTIYMTIYYYHCLILTEKWSFFFYNGLFVLNLCVDLTTDFLNNISRSYDKEYCFNNPYLGALSINTQMFIKLHISSFAL